MSERQNKNSRAKIAASNRYAARTYDRANIIIKKGTKAIIQAQAQAQGLSLNAYIQQAIQWKYKADTGDDIIL